MLQIGMTSLQIGMGMYIKEIRVEIGNKNEIAKLNKDKERDNLKNLCNVSDHPMKQVNVREPNWNGIILKEVAETPITRDTIVIGQEPRQEVEREVVYQDGVVNRRL